MKVLNIRLYRKPLKKGLITTRLSRNLARQLSVGDKYFSRLQPKHRAFFNRWVRQFALPIPVGLYVYKRSGSKNSPQNALAFITTMNQMAWIGLSTDTLKTDDWQNSIIHELLHLLFLLNIGDERYLTEDAEENMVIALAGWISRSKEGKSYSKRVLGI